MKNKAKIIFLIGKLSLVLINGQLCDQSIIDDPALQLCTNCSLVTDTKLCQYNYCQSGQYFSKKFGCQIYCGKLGIAYNLENCADTISTCVDGYYWSFSDNKCVKQQSLCTQNLYDSIYQIYICQNCSFASNLMGCQNSCSGSQYYNSQDNMCVKYCGNQVVVGPNESCQFSQSCINGYFWSNSANKCIKCENLFDPDFNVYFCPNCSFSALSMQTPGQKQCNPICPAFKMFSYVANQCVYYCGKGQIAVRFEFCLESTLCIEGYQWNNQENQCKKCNFILIDPNFLIYQCPNCSLGLNTLACQNICQIAQFYLQQQNKCMVYCENGKISPDLLSCQNSTICIDGFSWSPSDQKCLKNLQTTCPTYSSDSQVIQCLNCSLVSDSKYCQNCLTQARPYYSSQLLKCVYYCGNGLIMDDQGNCQTSNLCIDGFQWNSQQQKCVNNQQLICPSFNLDGFNLKQCKNNCLVSDFQFCNKSCFNSQKTYYSFYLATCLYYCGKGIIAENQELCKSQAQASVQCIDGYSWSVQYQKCIDSPCVFDVLNPQLKRCPNCSLVTNIQFCQNSCIGSELDYYDKQTDKCMAYCSNYVIAQNSSSCQTSILCIDGFSWDPQQGKCINNQQPVCDGIKNNDQFVFQCPNCSLVSNINQQQQSNQQCQNSCLNSQLPFWDQKQNKCLFYCGNGLIAQVQENCQSSNLCIDGLIFNSKGICSPINQNNQNISTNSTEDTRFLIAIIAIGVVLLLLIVIIIIFKIQQLKNQKQITEQIKLVSTENQQIKKQYQESEKQILKYQQERANANKQVETNQNDAEVNNKSQDFENEHLSEQTINKMSKNNNEYEQPQSSQQQLQQTPLIEIKISQ